MDSLGITSIGLISSVGRDAATSCASIRAGISRIGPVEHFPVLDMDSQNARPLSGHPIRGLTDGYSALARWLVLSRLAFLDLVAFGALPSNGDTAFWQNTGLVVVLPVLDDDRLEYAAHCHPENIDATFVQPLLERLGYPLRRQNIELLAQGRTGILQALMKADGDFKSRRFARCILLAVDAYLDGSTLGWLAEADRLKTEERETGLMPGEAAAAVMVEPLSSAKSQGAKSLATICHAVHAEEIAPFLSDTPNHGKSLSTTIKAVLKHPNITAPFKGDIIADLNGENWRAYEFGAAVSRLPREILGDYQLVLPCTSVGDTGAASTALQLVIGARALQRGYASSHFCLIACSSLDGQVGAILLQKGA
ncbi:MAG: hypothetical protein M0036_01380 [Desulfobacteraceae bacterium]|nr:hypothetical protein [Desulfobacteraceae bacterium]